MKRARATLAIFTVVFLMGGYFTSQYMQATGSAFSYIQALDRSAIPLLSLVLLVAAVVFAALPVESEEKGG